MFCRYSYGKKERYIIFHISFHWSFFQEVLFNQNLTYDTSKEKHITFYHNTRWRWKSQSWKNFNKPYSAGGIICWMIGFFFKKNYLSASLNWTFSIINISFLWSNSHSKNLLISFFNEFADIIFRIGSKNNQVNFF